VPASATLPSLEDQAARLLSLGLAERAGISVDELREATRAGVADALLVVHSDRLRATTLTPFLRHRGKAGFVVTDMTDVDEFTPVQEAAPPAADVYLVIRKDETSMVVHNFIKLARRFLSRKRSLNPAHEAAR